MVEPVVTYRVPGRSAEAEIEVKRSRFRCTLERVEDEAAARALVERLRREHWDARHHCSAFVVGPPPVPVERSSDDGEPAGTAGAPMLEVLRGAGLSDTAVVVTRWFGGTLLGAGDHAEAGRVETELRSRGVDVLETAYGARVRVLLGVDPAQVARTEGLLAELTSGAARPVVVGQRWVDGSPAAG